VSHETIRFWWNRFGPMFAAEIPLRRRKRAMLRFRRMRSLQQFAAVNSSIHNHFNRERHLNSRDNFKLNRAAALSERRRLDVA